MIRKAVFTSVFIGAFIVPPAHGEFLYRTGNSWTSPNHHCESNCKDWAHRVPVQTVCIETKREGTFLKNPTLECDAVDLCGWYKGGTPYVQAGSEGQKVCATYRNWSRPVTVRLTADVWK